MRLILQTSFLAGFILTAISCGSARLGTRPTGSPPNPVPPAAAQNTACLLWSRPLGAHISHTSITPDGRSILVSTSAERKTEARLRLFDSKGKLLWFKSLPQPVRGQDIGNDGKIIATSSYDGKLRVFSSNGRKLWEHEHLGRPIVLSAKKRILLINDDDAEPATAFISYDDRGKQIAAVTLTSGSEPLEALLADDESFVMSATASNQIAAFSIDGSPLWTDSPPGNIIAMAGTMTPETRIYVLSGAKSDNRSQRLTAFKPGSPGRLETIWSTSAGSGYETIKIMGDQILLYGNIYGGQSIAGYDAKDGAAVWVRAYPTPADYPSLVFSTPDYATIALDEGESAGMLRIAAVDRGGNAGWDTFVQAPNGIFSYALAPRSPALAVGAGQPGKGELLYFGMAKNCSGQRRPIHKQ